MSEMESVTFEVWNELIQNLVGRRSTIRVRPNEMKLFFCFYSEQQLVDAHRTSGRLLLHYAHFIWNISIRVCVHAHAS